MKSIQELTEAMMAAAKRYDDAKRQEDKKLQPLMDAWQDAYNAVRRAQMRAEIEAEMVQEQAEQREPACQCKCGQ